MDTKALKDKILQLAIQGKLVPQDENDEPASVLLERIKEEKEQLIKDKVIKKEKPLQEISDDEKSFELPNIWEWCRLGNICKQITDGAHKTPKYIDSGIPFLSVKNISKGYLDFSDTKYISEEEHKSLISRCNPQRNDLLFCRIGTLGRFKVIDIDTEFSIFVSLGLIKLSDNIYPKYMEYVLNSPELYSQYYEIKVDGSHTSKLNLRDIPNLKIPLPPLEEQKRIVSKVDLLFKLIDELDKSKQDLLQNISEARNKVLQLAIQGKLVSQDKNDEPASVLLEKIKEEKEQLIRDKVIKKEKPLPEITDDEKLFDLPSGWEWCRLSQISNYIKAGGDKPKDFSTVKNEEYKIPVIANGKTNTGIMGYTKVATENNICITVSGRGTIGYSCIRVEPFCPIVRLIVICPNLNINVSYLHYVLQYFIEQGVGTSVQQLTVPMITPKVIPLPPLEEQRRIVAKVDTIINYLDDLEKYIK